MDRRQVLLNARHSQKSISTPLHDRSEVLRKNLSNFEEKC